MLTNFLIRSFVKDYENTGNNDVRNNYAMLSGTTGIIANIALFLLKLSREFSRELWQLSLTLSIISPMQVRPL